MTLRSTNEGEGIDAPTPFNPLGYPNLTRNVVDELMRRDAMALPPQRFRGAGVYALFYLGADPEYSRVRSADASQPIYVGKAVPAGARKGIIEELGAPVGTELHKRLAEHAESIRATADLSLDDFCCRFLVVEPLWIVMAEQFLITKFRPLWNLRLDGFGNHNPGSGRHAGEISWWDARHPGRPWAASLRQTRTKAGAIARVREFFDLVDTNALLIDVEAIAAAQREDVPDE